MEEQTSWKGHSFTLVVFTGIVVLCSIFFILGMLVGRAQGQKLALSAAAGAASKTEAKPAEAKPDLTFYDSVKKGQAPVLQLPPPPKVEPVIPNTAKAAAAKPKREPKPIPPVVMNYQIGAVRKSGDADKLLDQVKKKGFKAFILAPPADDPNPYFRVQVGPFADMVEAAEAKKNLESAGYQPILKK